MSGIEGDEQLLKMKKNYFNSLVKQFGIKNNNTLEDSDVNICNQLYPCDKCQIEDEKMKQIQMKLIKEKKKKKSK